MYYMVSTYIVILEWFFCGNSGKIDYEIFSSPQLLSKAIVVEENKGTNNIKGDVYFVENESWGEVIYNIFRQMEQEKKAYTALEIHSPGHTMALGIKIKTIKKISLLLISMLPIRLRLINEYFFVLKIL